MPEIVITVKPNGETDVEALNYNGPSCILATNPYVTALGIQSGHKPKSEMFADQTASVEVSQ